MLIMNTTEILQKGEKTQKKTLHAIGNSHTSQYLLINKNEACVLGHFYGKYTFTNTFTGLGNIISFSNCNTRKIIQIIKMSSKKIRDGGKF